MALEVGGKCEWVLGRYLILRKTYGSSLFLFLLIFGKKKKTFSSVVVVVYFLIFFYFIN
jgi:hypothetical protein